MADSGPGPETDAGTGLGSIAGTPRWVKVLGIVALVLVLVVVIGLVTGLLGPGGHGPGRHTPSGDAGRPPSSVQEGHTPPSGLPEHGAQRP